METLLVTICSFAHEAHWILFVLLLLTGFNIPLSEDLLIIVGGALCSTCIVDHTLRMWLFLYFGCIFSAWIAYSLGRFLGPKLYGVRLFKSILNPQRIEKLHHYYEKFGVWTFVVGRFFPGGIRNGLFMTSGLGKMPFATFALRDAFAALISTSVLFALGYQAAQHADVIWNTLKQMDEWILLLLLLVGAGIYGFFLFRRG
jgi:membrane-associated protein